MVSKYILKSMGYNETATAPSCTDQFSLNQRALFFTKGNMNAPLEAVYDGAFGSIREMNPHTFSDITATKECMAIYNNGKLTVPCIIHKETQKDYLATLGLINATDRLEFSVSSVSPVEKIQHTAKECIAIYENGQFIVPCIAYKEAQKVYLATLDPINPAEGLKFSVSSASPVSGIQSTQKPDPKPDIYVPPTYQTQHIANFDWGKPGTLPDGWMMGITGEGNSDWQLEKDSTAPSSPLVLTQLNYELYPWCIHKNSQLTDGFVSVKFKTFSGEIDQAAGLIWRWKDADNYYVARANALEDNVSIYYIEGGIRYPLDYQDVPSDLPIKQNVWQTLRVDFTGNRFIVSFEGKTIVDVTDNQIEGNGSVGLWTKEDSVTSFDNFTYGGK